ncbi:hypothetical protein ACVIRO_007620 [Rhizobium ruizarguesonis]
MNDNRQNRIQAPLAYKAGPLDGIWRGHPSYTTARCRPSMPCFPGKRPAEDVLAGESRYDPEKLGYRTEELPGGFRYL